MRIHPSGQSLPSNNMLDIFLDRYEASVEVELLDEPSIT